MAALIDPALHRRDVARIGAPHDVVLRASTDRISEHALLERLQAELWLKGSLALR